MPDDYPTYDQELARPLDRDAWEIREVYARFGVAVYFCQVFETGLVNYLVLLNRVRGGRVPMQTLDEEFSELFGNTLGRNMHKGRKLLGDEGAWILDGEMAEALRLRNRLAHHWMRERALAMDHTDRRREILAELDAATDKLQAADAIVVEHFMAIAEPIGLTDDWIKNEYERLTSLAEAGEEDQDPPVYFRPQS